MQFILTDIRSLFKNTTNYKKRYDEFRDKKFVEIEIQELVTRTVSNLTKEPQLTYHLVDNTSLFSQDLIFYLKKISTSTNSKGNFLDSLSDGKIKMKNDQAYKVILSILENSAQIIYNIFNSPKEVMDKFVEKVRVSYKF